MKKLTYIFGFLACLTSCTDDLLPQVDDRGEIVSGEEVVFTTSVPKTMGTRALNAELLQGYQTIADDYELTIQMLEGNYTPVGTSSVYVPISDTSGTVVTYDSDGTLTPKQGQSPLHWESNTTKYAFEATAGTASVAADQSTPTLLLAQDRLHGYAFSPFEPENGDPADRIDAPNYHTSKEWYQFNKNWHDAEGQMLASDDYKKVPLFLQHERAWVTIILKAGKGVKRESVAALYNEEADTYNPNVKASIFSYSATDEEPFAVTKPLIGSAKVHYQADLNGGEVDSLNLKYEAIVEPHNFMENPKDDKIASISLSDLNFSFYASNDPRFSGSTANPAEMLDVYNLTAGKHLTIEATLSTDRIVFITAWIEDWTEVVTSTICDDYGQNGDPTVIKSRAELLSFLGDNDLNRAGNVAIISAIELDLDKLVTPGTTKDDPPTITNDPWTNYNSGLELNATLNLAGATIKTSGRLVKSISSTGNLLHGTIVMNNSTALTSAIAETNDGTIDNIILSVGHQDASATRASFVELNHGSILNCSSSLPVKAGDESDETYIGGIAAKSIAPDANTIPMIDHCTMYASVKGGENVKGGGIVGLGEGRLTYNTFDYGITLSQNTTSFKNIIHTKDSSGSLNTLTVGNNSWPTIAVDANAGVNVSNAKYNNVLDCQEELAILLTDSYNQMDYKYRVSSNFTVMAETWNYASDTEDITSRTDHCSGNLYCELDGNGKTITLDSDGSNKVQIPKSYDSEGKGVEFDGYVSVNMLFSNITGYVHDMTLELKKPLIATPKVNADGKYNATESVAALAYSVRKPVTVGTAGADYGVIRNVKVKIDADSFVQGATAAGLVCWVHHDGVVDNCAVKGSVLSWTPNNNVGSGKTDATRYVGGVVACAARGTISNSTYYVYSLNNWKTLDIVNGSGKVNTFYGGILGGTTVKEINSTREEPRVSIIDCSSWYQTTFDNASDAKRQHGSIVGSSRYATDLGGVEAVGTITEGDGACQGNWWQADMDGVALNGILNGYSVESTIGRRNAVMPTVENF